MRYRPLRHALRLSSFLAAFVVLFGAAEREARADCEGIPLNGMCSGDSFVYCLPLELKKVIKDPRIVTPTGKFNVLNTRKDIY